MNFHSRRRGSAPPRSPQHCRNGRLADDDDDCKAGGSLRLVNGRFTRWTERLHRVSALIKNGKFAAVGHRRGDDGDDECADDHLHGRTCAGIIDNHTTSSARLRPGHDTRIENAARSRVLSTLAARHARCAGDWITSLGASTSISSRRRGCTRSHFGELDTVTPIHPCSSCKLTVRASPIQKQGVFTANHVTVADDGSIASGAQSVRALNKRVRCRRSTAEARPRHAMTIAEVGVTRIWIRGFPNTFTGRKEDTTSRRARQLRRYRRSTRAGLYQERSSQPHLHNFLHSRRLDTPSCRQAAERVPELRRQHAQDSRIASSPPMATRGAQQ